MKNEPVMGIELVLSGHKFLKCFFHGQYGLAGCDTCSVRNPVNVRVDCHGGLTEGGVEHHIGGFTTNAWQSLQSLSASRYFVFVLFNQCLAGGNDIFGFGSKQPNGFDIGRQSRHAERQHFLRCAV